MQNVSLTRLAEAYLLSHQPPFKTPSTGHFYRYVLGNFLWFARREGWPDDARAIREAEIGSFLTYVSTEEVRWGGRTSSCCHQASPATCHHYARVIKSLFTFAEEEGYIERSPMVKIKLKMVRYREVPPYTDEEIAAMLEVCENQLHFGDRFIGARNHAIISIFADTGIRLSENANLTLKDIDPRGDRLRILGKGDKMRVVPLASEAKRSLRRYLKLRGENSYDELWLTDDGQPLEARGLTEMVIRLKKRAHIDGRGRAHRFRHYFATSMLNSGASIRHVQALLGHADPKMTLKYAHELELEEAITAHHRFSPLDRIKRRKVFWGDRDID